MRAILVVGLVAAAFGPAYSYLALLLVYSRRWADTEAAAALGLYSQYLVLLAANGSLESFVHSVANPRQLQRINMWLVGFAALHLGASVLAVRSGGAMGLLLADAANMAARIAYCLAFIARRFRGVGGFALRSMLPARWTLLALASTVLATGASRVLLLPESAGLWHWWQPGCGGGSSHSSCWAGLGPLAGLRWQARVVLHVLVGTGCLGVVAGVLLVCERDVLRELRKLRGSRGAQEVKKQA